MFHRCFLPSFVSFGQAVSEENICLNRQIRKKNCLRRPCLLTDRNEMCNLYKGPSIDAFCQELIHFSKRFQRRIYLKIKIKNYIWRSCLLTERDKTSNINIGPYIDASYQKVYYRIGTKCAIFIKDRP
jgi:hypothetical protein